MREFSPIVMLINTCHLSKNRKKNTYKNPCPLICYLDKHCVGAIYDDQFNTLITFSD